jgi:sugar lactone lactonase YvrE
MHVARGGVLAKRRAMMNRWNGFSLSLALAMSACTADVAQPEQLELPGTAYYPESLSAGKDGTLYVGSLTTGQVAAFKNGDLDSTIVISNNAVTGVAGVLAHDDQIWICSVDTTFHRATEVRSFDLHGMPQGTYPLAANQFCNDLAFDSAGNLYVTDSFAGSIMRLPSGGSALETFVSDPAFKPAAQGAFALDGIVAIGGSLYVNKLDTGGLFRIDLATKAITPITVMPALVAPDGMRALDDQTLLVVEGPGRLTKVKLAGATATATTAVDGLDQPTSVVQARGTYWVSQGQLGRLFATPAQQPTLPFLVRRVDVK